MSRSILQLTVPDRPRTFLPLLLLLVAVAGPAIADERHSNVTIEIEHPPPATTIEELRTRLLAALCGGHPDRTIRSGVGARIRLTVSVRPVSATTLRGFWLPFSGVYGVGSLRLAVERMVTVPGIERSVPAVVWQVERAVAGPWRKADQEIARSLDEMAAELRASGPKQQCGPLSEASSFAEGPSGKQRHADGLATRKAGHRGGQ